MIGTAVAVQEQLDENEYLNHLLDSVGKLSVNPSYFPRFQGEYEDLLEEIYNIVLKRRKQLPILAEIVEEVKVRVYQFALPRIAQYFDKFEVYRVFEEMVAEGGLSETPDEDIVFPDNFSIYNKPSVDSFIESNQWFAESVAECKDACVIQWTDTFIDDVSPRLILQILSDLRLPVQISYQSLHLTVEEELEMAYSQANKILYGTSQSLLFPELDEDWMVRIVDPAYPEYERRRMLT